MGSYFPRDSCTFLTEEITGGQNFNVAPNSQNGDFQREVLHFWRKIFRQIQFSNRLKFRGHASSLQRRHRQQVIQQLTGTALKCQIVGIAQQQCNRGANYQQMVDIYRKGEGGALKQKSSPTIRDEHRKLQQRRRNENDT